MKNKKLIIIYVTLIIITIAGLLGVTYGYVYTRVYGNESSKKITATSQTLLLEFSDGNDSLTSTLKGYFNPGSELTKTFTLTNKSNSKVMFNLIIDNIQNNFSRNDIVYELYEDEKLLSCPTKNMLENNLCLLPKTSTAYLATYLDYEVNDTHDYRLVIKYLNSKENQIEDKGKTLSGKIDIELGVYNPYSENTDSLAYKILNNAIEAENNNEKTIFSVNPLSKPLLAKNDVNERTLSITRDDDGDTYYYRGNVKDNYVNFAGMCWRIIRITSNGDIKIILDDQYTTCDDNETTISPEKYTGNWGVTTAQYGYDASKKTPSGVTLRLMAFLNPQKPATSLITYMQNFQTTIASKLNGNISASSSTQAVNQELSNYLTSGNWCFANNAYGTNGTLLDSYSEAYNPTITYTTNSNYYNYSNFINFNYSSNKLITKSINKNDSSLISLKCDGMILNNFSNQNEIFVGSITLEEALFSGINENTNKNMYLYNGYDQAFWTMTPSHFLANVSLPRDFAYYIAVGAAYRNDSVTTGYQYFRPVVTLHKNTIITNSYEDGTITNPYNIW